MARDCRLWEITNPSLKPGMMTARRVTQTIPYAPLVRSGKGEAKPGETRFHDDGRYVAGSKMQHENDLIKYMAQKGTVR